MPGVDLKPGDVIDVREPDYLYGVGQLKLRVTKIGPVRRLRDGDWLDLEGLALRPDGSQLDFQPRRALVRLSALGNRPRRPGQP
jgi:hypothetical protein